MSDTLPPPHVLRTYLYQLTGRQCDVLALGAYGLTSRQIGHRLGIAELTVRQHVRTACQVLETSSRTHACVRAHLVDVVPMPALPWTGPASELRRAILQYSACGLTLRQISARLEKPLDTVKWQVKKAISQTRPGIGRTGVVFAMARAGHIDLREAWPGPGDAAPPAYSTIIGARRATVPA